MSLFGPIVKFSRALKERGLKGTLTQLYTIGDLKFGELKGVDKFGNHYYEDLDLPYGQHRWVEYGDIHNPDASMIQPEWHGWMHHVFDETPETITKQDRIDTTTITHANTTSHVGKIGEEVEAQPTVNTSQYRQRGYNIGSLHTAGGEQDNYYKQPGHPLSNHSEEGRFKHAKERKEWVPSETHVEVER